MTLIKTDDEPALPPRAYVHLGLGTESSQAPRQTPQVLLLLKVSI